MTYTPPDVHRTETHPNGIVAPAVDLGYVDRNGVYYFPSGTHLPVDGGYVDPEGTRRLGRCRIVVRADGALGTLGPQDGGDPEANVANAKHHVDAAYQATYDADPDAFANAPGDVFTTTEGN